MDLKFLAYLIQKCSTSVDEFSRSQLRTENKAHAKHMIALCNYDMRKPPLKDEIELATNDVSEAN
eukprot:5728822-Heterocapsa_arctica.AAC.1